MSHLGGQAHLAELACSAEEPGLWITVRATLPAPHLSLHSRMSAAEAFSSPVVAVRIRHQAFPQPQTSTGPILLVGRELDLVDVNIGVRDIQTRSTFGLELASPCTSLRAKM